MMINAEQLNVKVPPTKHELRLHSGVKSALVSPDWLLVITIEQGKVNFAPHLCGPNVWSQRSE